MELRSRKSCSRWTGHEIRRLALPRRTQHLGLVINGTRRFILNLGGRRAVGALIFGTRQRVSFQGLLRFAAGAPANSLHEQTISQIPMINSTLCVAPHFSRNSSAPFFASTWTVWPSRTLPSRMLIESGSRISFWIVRRSGRAP